MVALDLDFARRQFPAFAEPSLKGTAFFENAGGSYMCQPVLDRLDTYLRQLKLQPYHASSVSTEAGQWLDSSYQALAPWLNVRPDEIYFGPSTSQNTYVLAQAVWGWIKPGDEIIVTNQDHEANGGVWRRLAERGVVVHEWQVQPDTGKLLLTDLQALLHDRVKLLVFPHCSNILGDVNPVADICALAHKYAVRTIVDGVSFAGHGLPDCQALGADIYLFSLYKVYGPHQGVMVIKRDMAHRLTNQSHFFNDQERTKRLYPAGPDHAQVAAIQGVGEYFRALCEHHGIGGDGDKQQRAQALRKLLQGAETAQLETLLDYFAEHPKVRIIGPQVAVQRAPTVSILVKGHQPMALSRQLGAQGILCGAGHFYSYRLLDAMGLDPQTGVLRFSMVHYTSHQDVQQLLAAMHRILV